MRTRKSLSKYNLLCILAICQFAFLPFLGKAQDSTRKLLDVNNSKLIKSVNKFLDSSQKKINNSIFNKANTLKGNLNAGLNSKIQSVAPLLEDRPLPYETLTKKKYTLSRRAYQNTMAQFNYFFNGTEELKDFIKKARIENEDDYTSDLIPFYDYSLNSTAKNSIDSIIYRCNANIVLHDLRSNWIDDSYLLLAKAYLFHKNFDTAASILQFINYSFDNKENGMDVPIGSNLRNTKGKFSIATADNNRFWENENVRNESMLWQARTYFETGALTEGISLLQLLKSDAIFPKKLHPFLNEQMAYGYYQMELYDSAATYLINAIPNAPDELAKSRWYFLIAQLWQKKENWKNAYTWYKQASEHSVNPIVGVYSKINMTRIDAQNSNKPWLDLAYQLERMGQREKYSLYKDIIYFEMAKLAIQNKAFDKANEWLIVSIKKNVANFSQKQKAFELLGAINYNNSQYAIARLAYDSVSTILKSNPNFEQILLRKKWMSTIDNNHQILQLEDTLQYIYHIPAEKQKGYYTAWQKRIKKEADKIKSLFTDSSLNKSASDELDFNLANNNTNTFGNNGNNFSNTGFQNNNQSNNNFSNNNRGNSGGTDFYFDNKSLVAQGKQSFIQKWGERPNVDQWRRKASASVAYSAAKQTNLNPLSIIINDTAKKDSTSNTTTATIAALIKDSMSFNTSAFNWNNAALKNAQTFLLELNDFEKAFPLYKLIIQKNMTPTTTERAMLDLASHFIHIGKQNSADSLIQIVENRFPTGFYVSQKTAQQNKVKKERSIIEDYKEAYFLTQIGNWDSLANLALDLNKSLRGTKWFTPFQFLKVKMYAQQRQDSTAIVLLDSIILQNNNERIRDKAKNIIAEIKKRKDTEAYLTSLKIVMPEQVLITFDTTIATPALAKGIAKAADENIAADKQAAKVAPEPSIVFTKDSSEPYYVAIVTNKVKPVFVKEMQTAFSLLNNDEFIKQKLNVTYVQFEAETYILWIGPFNNLNASAQYLNKVKPRLSAEIISFVSPKQYEMYLLGKSNILLIKSQEELLLYKQFMLNNIYKP